MNEIITITKMIEIGKLQKKLDRVRYEDVSQSLINPNAISLLYLKEDYQTEPMDVVEYYQLFLLKLSKKDRDKILKKWNYDLVVSSSPADERVKDNIVRLLDLAYERLIDKKISGFV